MSNLDATPIVPAPRSKIRKPKVNLPAIEIDGETWIPRKDFAATVGICDVSAKRLNLRTTYVGGVAYVCFQDGLRKSPIELAAAMRRPS
jgi:hypothetical protein